MLEGTQAAFTSLFDNSVLHQIERMRLRPQRRLTNRARGEHLSGKGGSSTDFADFRDYAAGDDLRYVDWNIFARLQRPYIKQFQHEEELHVVLLVDASASMLSGGKLERAKQAAAAFGIMGLLSGERVSAYAVQGLSDSRWMLPPGTGRTRMRQLLHFFEGVEGGGSTAVEQAIEQMLKFHRGRGIAVVLSDFLTFGSLTRPLNLLFSAGLEVWGLQILSESEIQPDVQGDLRFVDSETGETLDITNASELLHVYHDQRLALEQSLDSLCRSRQGRFVSVSAGESFSAFLFDRMCRQGWVQR